MSRAGTAFLLLAAVTLLGGCRRAPAQAAPEVVATVGGEEVRWEEFEGYLDRHLGDSGASLGSDVLSELFDQYLSERLLVRLAVERGVTRDGAAASGAARRRAVDRLLAAEDGATATPSDEEIAAFYAAHRDDFQRPERVRLRQILVDDRAVADRALAELRDGADFEELGARLAADPALAAETGYEGELSHDDLPRAFADTIFALAPGEVSEVVAADYGFHLFQVVERLPSEVVPPEEARPEIVRRLLQEAADRRLEELIEQARRRYDVAVHDRNLPFNYRGRYLDG